MIILPQIIDRIIVTAFYPEGVIRLNRLEESDFGEIPVLRQVICLCRFIREENGKLKLTKTGNLPLKVVREIYLAGVTDWYHEKYPDKKILETDAKFVMIARDLATVSGIIRKQNNALMITRKGEKLLADRQLLLETLIRDFVHRFDPDRYDGYHINPGLGYRDAGLSLLLFDKVRKQMPGKTPADMDYVKAYFDIRTGEYDGRVSKRCYLFRTYQNFMELFGLVTTEEKWIMEEVQSLVTIKPTPLFDRMIFIADDYDRITVRMNPELKICRLKITLAEADPPVWRQIQVPSSLSLNDLHYLIQYAIGWENAHLHEFEKEGVCYTDNVDEELPSVQYDRMMISDLLKDKGDTMLYRYDFGDNWEHIIEMEELFTPQEGTDYRVCMDGARRCPPEDCGGVHGYHQMLKVLNDPEDTVSLFTGNSFRFLLHFNNFTDHKILKQ
jgi:hypothetical protein